MTDFILCSPERVVGRPMMNDGIEYQKDKEPVAKTRSPSNSMEVDHIEVEGSEISSKAETETVFDIFNVEKT